jgi:hypothetical protein
MTVPARTANRPSEEFSVKNYGLAKRTSNILRMKKSLASILLLTACTVGSAAAQTPGPGAPRTLPDSPESMPANPVPPTGIDPTTTTTTTTTTDPVDSKRKMEEPRTMGGDGSEHGGHNHKEHGGHKEQTNHRPEEFSFGIGVGYLFPASWRDPNLVSARFRLASGLMFEPRVELTNNSRKQEVGAMSETNSVTDINAATVVHIPWKSRGNVDLNILGAVSIGYQVQDPPGEADKTTSTLIGVGYGLGLNYWIRRHWTVSLTATNTLLQRLSSEQENPVTPAAKQTDFTIGAVWNPQVTMMVHLNL